MKITNNTVFQVNTLGGIPKGDVVRSARTGGLYINATDKEDQRSNVCHLVDLETGETLHVTPDYVVYPVTAELVVS